MEETIKIRRLTTGVEVSVTWKAGAHTVMWKERVLGATKETLAGAIAECRRRNQMFALAIEAAEEVAA